MKPKILILTDWYLPGTNAGGPVRSIANLVDHLKDEFAFNIVSRNTDYCEDIPYPDIIADEWNELEKHVNVYYFSKDRLSKSNLKNLLFSTDFDVLYLNGIYSWWFSILPLLLVRNSLKKIIVAPRGMFNEQAFSTKGFKKKVFIHLARWMSLYKHVVFQATNEMEKDRINHFIGKSNPIYITPNLHRKVKQDSWLEKKKERGQLNLVSIARVAPEKGTLHALHFLSKIKLNKSDSVSFSLYGSIYSDAYWKKCENIIKAMPPNIKVKYMGSVDGEEVQEVLSSVHFLFMPSEGENFGHSILEALSAGCPVIISDQTPWCDLENKRIGWDITLDQKGQFVHAIKTAARMDQETYNEWSLNASNFAKEYCNQEINIEKNRKLFN